jgi:hypothetical protein
VNQLLGSGGIGGLSVRIGAAEKTIADHTTLITRANELTAQNFLTLNDRVTILEQKSASASGGSGTGGIRTDLNTLTNDFTTYVGFNNGRVDTLRSQMDAVLNITGSLPGQLQGALNAVNLIDERITNLKLWQLNDVPDSYVGQGGKVLQVLYDESAVTFSALTAGLVEFTPTGGLSSTDVQSALNELDTEKARLDGAAFSGAVTVPDAAYGSGWDGSAEVPTKNAIYDKIESLAFVTTFTGLTDVPDSYIGHGLHFPQIKADGSGLQFVQVNQLPGGGASQTILQKYGAGDGEVTWSALTAGIVTTSAGGYGDVQTALSNIISRLIAGGL